MEPLFQDHQQALGAGPPVVVGRVGLPSSRVGGPHPDLGIFSFPFLGLLFLSESLGSHSFTYILKTPNVDP